MDEEANDMGLIDGMVRGSFELLRATFGTGLRLTSSVVGQFTDEEKLEELRHDLARQARDWLEVPESLAAGTIAGSAVSTVRGVMPEPGVDAEERLRRRFRDLLARSSDVGDDYGEPALLEIVEQMSPDEARLLRFLAEEGPTPYIDLMRASVVGTGSDAVLYHLSMAAERAGCRHPDRTQAYLENLRRLGVIALPKSPIDGHPDYQLLEGLDLYIQKAKEIRADRNSRPRMRKGHIVLTALGQRLIEIALGPNPPDEGEDS
ncbi:MAG: Abi-alpha family protein [Nitriliruptorales bacterium]|nr:Abi-alpha family protein [Nitriliruptorales bacterium]